MLIAQPLQSHPVGQHGEHGQDKAQAERRDQKRKQGKEKMLFTVMLGKRDGTKRDLAILYPSGNNDDQSICCNRFCLMSKIACNTPMEIGKVQSTVCESPFRVKPINLWEKTHILVLNSELRRRKRSCLTHSWFRQACSAAAHQLRSVLSKALIWIFWIAG